MKAAIPMSRNAIIITAVTVVALIIILYFVFRKPKTTPAPQAAPGTNPAPPVLPKPNESSSPTATDHFPLQVGSRGDNVKYLQRALNMLAPTKGPKLEADGDFGSITRTKLLMAVETSLSTLPMSYDNYLTILKRANATATAPKTPEEPWYSSLFI